MADYDILVNAHMQGFLNKELDSLSGNLRNLLTTIDRVNDVTRNYEKSQRALNSALGIGSDGQKVYAKNLLDASKNAAVLSSNLRLAKKQAQEFNSVYSKELNAARFNKLTFGLKTFNGQSKEVNASLLATARNLKNIQSSARAIRFTAALRDSQSLAKNVLNIGKNLQYVGRNLTIGLTLPLVQFFRIGLDSFKKLETEIVRFEKIVGRDAVQALKAQSAEIVEIKKTSEGWTEVIIGTGNAYDAFSKKLDNVSYKYGVARELVQAVAADFATVGISGTDVIGDLVELAAIVEKVGDVDMTQSREFVQSLVQNTITAQNQNKAFKEQISLLSAAEQSSYQYRLAVDQVTGALALFNVIENNTVVTLEKLAKGIPEMQAVTTQFGLTLGEAAALFAPMLASGFETGASANSLKVSLQRLVAPTIKNQNTLAYLNRTIGEFNYTTGVGIENISEFAKAFVKLKEQKGELGALELFAELFGVRQGSRMLAAMNDFGIFQEELLKRTSTANKIATVIVDSINKTVADAGQQSRLAEIVEGGKFSASDIAGLGKIGRVVADEYAAGFEKGGTALYRAIIEGQGVALDKLKKEFGEDSDILDLITSQSGKVILAQALGTEEAIRAFNEEVDRALETPAVKLSRAKETFKAISRTLIPDLVSALEALMPTIRSIANFFTNMNEGSRRFLSGIVLLAAALGPIISVFSNLTQILGLAGGAAFRFVGMISKLRIFGLGGISIASDTLAGLNNLDKFGKKLSRISDQTFFFKGTNKEFQKLLKKSQRLQDRGSESYGIRRLANLFKWQNKLTTSTETLSGQTNLFTAAQQKKLTAMRILSSAYRQMASELNAVQLTFTAQKQALDDLGNYIITLKHRMDEAKKMAGKFVSALIHIKDSADSAARAIGLVGDANSVNGRLDKLAKNMAKAAGASDNLVLNLQYFVQESAKIAGSTDAAANSVKNMATAIADLNTSFGNVNGKLGTFVKHEEKLSGQAAGIQNAADAIYEQARATKKLANHTERLINLSKSAGEAIRSQSSAVIDKKKAISDINKVITTFLTQEGEIVVATEAAETGLYNQRMEIIYKIQAMELFSEAADLFVLDEGKIVGAAEAAAAAIDAQVAAIGRLVAALEALDASKLSMLNTAGVQGAAGTTVAETKPKRTKRPARGPPADDAEQLSLLAKEEKAANIDLATAAKGAEIVEVEGTAAEVNLDTAVKSKSVVEKAKEAANIQLLAARKQLEAAIDQSKLAKSNLADRPRRNAAGIAKAIEYREKEAEKERKRLEKNARARELRAEKKAAAEAAKAGTAADLDVASAEKSAEAVAEEKIGADLDVKAGKESLVAAEKAKEAANIQLLAARKQLEVAIEQGTLAKSNLADRPRRNAAGIAKAIEYRNSAEYGKVASQEKLGAALDVEAGKESLEAAQIEKKAAKTKLARASKPQWSERPPGSKPWPTMEKSLAKIPGFGVLSASQFGQTSRFPAVLGPGPGGAMAGQIGARIIDMFRSAGVIPPPEVLYALSQMSDDFLKSRGVSSFKQAGAVKTFKKDVIFNKAFSPLESGVGFYGTPSGKNTSSTGKLFNAIRDFLIMEDALAKQVALPIPNQPASFRQGSTKKGRLSSVSVQSIYRDSVERAMAPPRSDFGRLYSTLPKTTRADKTFKEGTLYIKKLRTALEDRIYKLSEAMESASASDKKVLGKRLARLKRARARFEDLQAGLANNFGKYSAMSRYNLPSPSVRDEKGRVSLRRIKTLASSRNSVEMLAARSLSTMSGTGMLDPHIKSFGDYVSTSLRKQFPKMTDARIAELTKAEVGVFKRRLFDNLFNALTRNISNIEPGGTPLARAGRLKKAMDQSLYEALAPSRKGINVSQATAAASAAAPVTAPVAAPAAAPAAAPSAAVSKAAAKPALPPPPPPTSKPGRKTLLSAALTAMGMGGNEEVEKRLMQQAEAAVKSGNKKADLLHLLNRQATDAQNEVSKALQAQSAKKGIIGRALATRAGAMRSMAESASAKDQSKEAGKLRGIVRNALSKARRDYVDGIGATVRASNENLLKSLGTGSKLGKSAEGVVLRAVSSVNELIGEITDELQALGVQADLLKEPIKAHEIEAQKSLEHFLFTLKGTFEEVQDSVDCVADAARVVGNIVSVEGEQGEGTVLYSGIPITEAIKFIANTIRSIASKAKGVGESVEAAGAQAVAEVDQAGASVVSDVEDLGDPFRYIAAAMNTAQDAANAATVEAVAEVEAAGASAVDSVRDLGDPFRYITGAMGGAVNLANTATAESQAEIAASSNSIRKSINAIGATFVRMAAAAKAGAVRIVASGNATSAATAAAAANWAAPNGAAAATGAVSNAWAAPTGPKAGSPAKTPMTGKFASMIAGFKDSMSGIGGVFTKGWGEVLTANKGVLNSLRTLVGTLGKTLLNSAKLLGSLVMGPIRVASGVFKLAKKNVAGAADIGKAFGSILKNLAKTAVDLVKGVLSAVVSVGKTVVSVIGTVAKSMMSAFQSVTKLAIKGIIFAPIVAAIIVIAVAAKRLSTAFKAVDENGKRLESMQKIVDRLKQAWTAFKSVLVALFKPFADVLNNIFGVSNGTEAATQNVSATTRAFSKLGAVLIVALEQITNGLNKLRESEGFKKFIKSMTSFMYQFFNIAKAVFGGIKAVISGDSEEAASKFGEAADRIKLYMMSIVIFLAPMWRKMLLKMISSLVAFAKTVLNIGEKVLEGLAHAFGPPLVKAVVWTIKKVLTLFFSLPRYIPKILLKIIEMAIEFKLKYELAMRQLVINIVLILAGMLPGLAQILIKAFNMIIEFALKAQGALESALKSLSPFGFLDDAIGLVGSVFSSPLEFASATLEGWVEDIASTEGTFKGVINDIAGAINKAFDSVYNLLDQGINAIFDSDVVNDFVQDISDSIDGWSQGQLQDIFGWIDDLAFGEDGDGGVAAWFANLDIPDFKGSEFERAIDDFAVGAEEWVGTKFDEIINKVADKQQELKDQFKEKYGVEFDAVPGLFTPEIVADVEAMAKDIANAYTQAINAGGESLEDAAANAGNSIKDALLDAMQKFVDLVVDYLASAIDKLKADITDKLTEQKDAYLQVFDDQIAAIDALEKAEEELFRKQERIEEDRKRMRDRALQEENYRRNRTLAIYEGRIDDARMLDLEQRKIESDNAYDDAKTARERAREEQKNQRDIVREILENQKRDAEEAFDLILENFQKFIEEIGKYGTYNQEELEEQFKEIIESAEGASEEMLSAFEDYYKAIPDLIDQYTDSTVGFFENPLDQLVELARDRFGLTSNSESPDTILGATAMMLSGMGNQFTDPGGHLQMIPGHFETVFTQVIENVIQPSIDSMHNVIENFRPEEIFQKALDHANLTIQREYAKIVGSTNSVVDDIASAMSELTRNIVTSMAQITNAVGAAQDALNGFNPGASPIPIIDQTAAKNSLTSYFRSIGMQEYMYSSTVASLAPYASELMERFKVITDNNVRNIVYKQIAAKISGSGNQSSFANWVKATYGAAVLNPPVSFANGGLVKKYGYGGMAVPGFGSTAVPAILHGGEFVLNKKAVERSGIGIKMLEQLNKARFDQGGFSIPDVNSVRFNNPSRNMNSGVVNHYNSTNTTNIYVENFIGEDQWFQSMLKEYNMKHKPLADKRVGNENRFYTSYKGGN